MWYNTLAGTLSICGDLLEAISNFPKLMNITGVRAWFGLVNQVAIVLLRQRRWHYLETC